MSSHVVFIWIPNYDAVDVAAKQATSFARITDNIPLPVADYKQDYRKLILKKGFTLGKPIFQQTTPD